MTHTKGPWIVVGQACYDDFIVVDAEKNLIAAVAHAEGVESRNRHARLIAAAPALYAALKDALVCINQVMEKTPDLVLSHAHRQLTAALAQADGKEQP